LKDHAIERELKQPLLAPKVSTPSSNFQSELERHRLQITAKETAITATNAIQESLGTTSILSSLHLFLFYTTLDQGGLGIALGTTVGLASLGAMSCGTLLLTIPLSVYAYKNYKQEAEKLVATINKDEAARQRYREELFLDLLSLRCLYAENEDNFLNALKDIDLDNDEIDIQKLLAQINKVYLNTRFQTKHVDIPHHQVDDQKQTPSTLMTILSNPILAKDRDMRNYTIKQLRTVDKQLADHLHTCYKPIPFLAVHNRKEAIIEGVTKFFSMAGAMFGLSTTYAGIILTAGFCIALSATGWGILIAAMLLSCLAFGLYAGAAKQKNLQREELQSQIKDRNNTLIFAKRQTQRVLTKKHLQLAEHKAEHAANLHAELSTSLQQEVATNASLRSQLHQEEKSNSQMSARVDQLEIANTELQTKLSQTEQSRVQVAKEYKEYREKIELERQQMSAQKTSANSNHFFSQPVTVSNLPANQALQQSPNLSRAFH
jgi:hypothetical protein